MKFGFFDDVNREYVITNPATPRSWSNYLGNTEYGAIITNNAGGYSFYKSGGAGRFTRFRFNSIPMDQPGRYIYLHDHDSHEYWSLSWQPVAKPLDQYKSVCRHGLGYSIIESSYKNINSSTTYFVPIGKDYEIWLISVTNTGNEPRNLSAFTYTEYAGNWNALDDMLNLQYTQYTAQMNYHDGIIDHGTNVYIPENTENFYDKDQGRHSFLTAANAEIIGFDTERETFLGPYRTYQNPIVVEQGKCRNSLAWGNNACGTLQCKLSLAPGETRQFVILMGVGSAQKEGAAIRKQYEHIGKAHQELDELQQYWQKRISGISVQTPDRELNSVINVWSIYNCHITFAWSRAASLIYTASERNGYGYRDTVQDTLGVAHCIIDEVRERLELMISGQVSTGGAMPVISPINHKPGQMEAPVESKYRSDDCLWLFFAVPNYVKESGDINFFKKIIPYADQGEDSVMGHLRRAIEFNLNWSGKNGLPCGLSADWNDCLCFGKSGESVFVAMQLRHALKTYLEIAQMFNLQSDVDWAQVQLYTLDSNIARVCWDGQWFVRGFREDGVVFGSEKNEEGKIFLNPQAWAVISEFASQTQTQQCLDSLSKNLLTDYGLQICYPAYQKTDHQIVKASLMNPGLKENGGIFIHPQAWAVMAEVLRGNGNRAYEYLKSYLPVYQNDVAEIREVEPYVLCQSTCGPSAPTFGRSRVPWLTGAASWTYYVISQYLFGIRPHYDGIEIDPCIPSHWTEFTITRIFRNKTLTVTVNNAAAAQKGVNSVILNGKPYSGTIIADRDLLKDNEIIATMG